MDHNTNVIDNDRIKLIEQLQKSLPRTKRANIAVGYFFISGFARIMNNFDRIESSTDPSHMIRLLISPTTNKATAEALFADNESYETVRDSRIEVPDKDEELTKTRDGIKSMMEYMPQTDDDRLAALKLKDLISRGKMQVRVYTKEKLHAKAYICELEGEEIDAMAIVGSSNLSIAGISDNTELNLRTTHSGDSKELLEWFERHWKDGSEFTSDMADIIDESWIAKHEPSDIYNKALLHEHEDKFNLCVIKDPPPGANAKKLFEFQKIAVAYAIKKLDAFGGVMISDVVGTGKTLIGTAILKHLVDEHNSNPLIICPPHLIGMWEQYLYDYGITGSVLSRYKIGLDKDLLPRHSNHDVILIDESHNFRTRTTQSYKALMAFMEEKTEDARIIMLSATPISNTLADLRNQLALFPREMLSKIDVLSQTTLDEYFKKTTNLDGTVTDAGRDKIQELLRHILIRRTRTQIKKKYATYDKSKDLYYLMDDEGRKYFPKRVLKNPKEYDIEKVYNNEFQSIAETLKNLKLARYNPGEYIRKEYLDPAHPQFQKYDDLRSSSLPLVGIVRTLLLKRVESSIEAFKDSINNYREGHRLFRIELGKDNVPIGEEFHDIIYRSVTDTDYDNSDYDKDMLKIKSEYSMNAFDKERWISDIKHDSDQFSKMQGYLGPEEKFNEHDDKLAILIELLKEMVDDKILIFSESASTARYVAKYLKTKEIQEKIQHRTIEQIDSNSDVAKSDIIWRFDPYNNPKPKKPSNKGRIDILVSTDVLSEGVNLQSGRVVINYDFHWNPVRLIQRVGRVDRIGTRHDLIEIFNFLPTDAGEKELKLENRVIKKIELIKSIIGGDQRILKDTETFDSNSIEGIYAGNNEMLDTENIGVLDMKDSQADDDSDKIKNDEELLAEVRALPFGMRGASSQGDLLIACEAEETVTRDDGKLVTAKKFRKHYMVNGGGGATLIWQSSFLKKLGENARFGIEYSDSEYNKLISIAWKKFNRDIDNAIADTKIRIHQKYFEKKLKNISSNPDLADRAARLLPFITRMMISNDEPYKSLTALHKKIDASTDIDDVMIISELEIISVNHEGIFTKKIHKPKILYSIMVKE